MRTGKERTVIAKLIIDMELREQELKMIVDKLEAKNFGFGDMMSHLCEYKEARGRLNECQDTIKRLKYLIAQFDDYGFITFDYEIPF